MRVLWIVNIPLPAFAKYLGTPIAASGTWMIDLLDQLALEEGVNLGVACVYGSKFVSAEIEGVHYYALPGDGKSMMFYKPQLEKYWDMVESDFSPDIVHIHGTEYTHSISYIRKYPEKKYLLTIQGIISKVCKYRNDGLSIVDLLVNRTAKENLRLSGMIEKTIVSRKNANYEKEIIRSVGYVTGRTDWDRFIIESINPSAQYYRCYYNLRSAFYSAQKWSIESSDRAMVFVSTAAQLPLKGGHIVLEAIKLVCQKHPEVRFVFLAQKQVNGRLVTTNGYTKLINKRIAQLGIENNVLFVGQQDTDGVIGLMQKSRICVIPSAVENASATMREAMHIGTPVIASYRGGMVNLIKDGDSGFYYDYGEHEFLAGRIVQLLEDDELALRFSQNEIAIAEEMHQRDRNKRAFVDIYSLIMDDEAR